MPEYAAKFAEVLAQSRQPESPFTQQDAAALVKSAGAQDLGCRDPLAQGRSWCGREIDSLISATELRGAPLSTPSSWRQSRCVA
jgi:hypothetical protein